MRSTGGCLRRGLPALAVAISLLSGCATAPSEPVIGAICPPVVAYDAAFLARAAEEMACLPEGGAAEILLRDYATTRAQLRAGAGG